MLWPESPASHPNWRELLATDLLHPAYHVSFAEALGWRLRRNYVWLYATLLLTWSVKVATHPDPISWLDEFFTRAALGPVPGWLMILIGFLFNGTLIVVAILTYGMRSASGEVMPYREARAKIQTTTTTEDDTARHSAGT